MSKVTEIFGSMVFDDETMRKYLPEETYYTLRRTVKDGRHLNLDVANVVAAAMKDWAIEKGATHFTHWFQPLNGVTAEKHDSFIVPAEGGKALMEFSGKELVKGESDASSFPSGGLRATFEARGYTAWDATSYAFIKENTLCIPTAFCSYSGEALDKKTPLLRSMEAVGKAAIRVLRLFGNDTAKTIRASVGPEQEYFLVDKELFEQRPDLLYTGRTLFGAMPPKGQELDDHYFGAIKPRVKAFMEELDRELWKLGILAKTEHNEGAPSQHELAPIYSTANIATDHNQLTMELMQKVARRHGMVCLLHEKPFKGVSGSGKHNNWSLSTDTGINLFEPGETPSENAQFLLFLAAVIKAVDEYQELLRASVATAGNDHRLGASEAPPAVVSIFLGDELQAILDAIENELPYGVKEKELLRIGVHTLPKFPKDTTDRNRTSPFAFTGNKFEFRMPGSAASIADCNVVLNTAVARELRLFAEELETAEDFESCLHSLIVRTIKEHKRILFNGNGYDDAWISEAERRGLANFRTAPDALPAFVSEKSITLFTEEKVLSEAELRARHEILTENYCKIVRIEALTMLEMTRGGILPAISRYVNELCDTALKKKSLGIAEGFETAYANRLSNLADECDRGVTVLSAAVERAKAEKDVVLCASIVKSGVLPAMESLRRAADEAESLTAKDVWPYPSYGDMLLGIR